MENYDIEIKGDLLDEYNAIQEAEEGNEPELVNEIELRKIMRELWNEIVPVEEYTEEDAYRDYIMDQKEDYDG